ncbi:MAG: hypothetical protein ACJ8F7_09700 [Gemmataceae bacterium]
MFQFSCPNCHAVLKRDAPLPAGKKLRCPKCATVFAPAGEAAAAPAAAAKPKRDDDYGVDRNPYAVKQEEEMDDAIQEEKQRAAMGLVRDRFKRSKRGPAMKETTRPANFMMAIGVFIAVIDIVLFMIGLFPLVFWDFYNSESNKPPPGMKYSEWEDKKKSMPKKAPDPDEVRAVYFKSAAYMGGATLHFVVAGCICIGAYKMRTIESYTWSWIGAVLCLLFGTMLGLLVGIWAIMTLNNPVVKAGFAERAPPEI